MAGQPLVSFVLPSDNACATTAFRYYLRDNFETIRNSCTVFEVQGRATSRYKNNSHAMWLDLGLDSHHCMAADFLNNIDGDTDLNLLSKVYLPDSRELDKIARKVNR